MTNTNTNDGGSAWADAQRRFLGGNEGKNYFMPATAENYDAGVEMLRLQGEPEDSPGIVEYKRNANRLRGLRYNPDTHDYEPA